MGRLRIKALIKLLINELIIIITAIIIFRRLRIICFKVMLLLRNWILTRKSSKINVYLLVSVACCKKVSLFRLMVKLIIITSYSFSDFSVIVIRDGSFFCWWWLRYGRFRFSYIRAVILYSKITVILTVE